MSLTLERDKQKLNEAKQEVITAQLALESVTDPRDRVGAEYNVRRAEKKVRNLEANILAGTEQADLKRESKKAALGLKIQMAESKMATLNLQLSAYKKELENLS